MARIVAGRFDGTLDADAALAELKREGFNRSEVDSFYVSPPGQNDLNASGGDAPHSSEGSRGAGKGAALGAAIGLVVGLLVGYVGAFDLGRPTIPLAGLLGALVGCFAGALSRMRGGRRSAASIEHPVEAKGGRMIAVNVERDGTEARAIAILRLHNARDIGRTQGTWSDGSWRDFDPRTPLGTV